MQANRELGKEKHHELESQNNPGCGGCIAGLRIVRARYRRMIVYWLSQDSNITPPVCIAAFAGATIAQADMWKTAFSAFKFAKFLYLAPFLFGYVPAFSLGGSASDIMIAFVLIIIGTWGYSWLLSGIWLDRFTGGAARA